MSTLGDDYGRWVDELRAMGAESKAIEGFALRQKELAKGIAIALSAMSLVVVRLYDSCPEERLRKWTREQLKKIDAQIVAVLEADAGGTT